MKANVRDKAPFLIRGTEQWNLSSRGGREYRIMVWRPDTPAPAEGFPVIYMLDGNAAFGSMVETMRLFTRGPHRIQPAVVVGIGYETDEPLDTASRFYDYTTRATEEELPPRKDESAWPTTGGADEFLAFIEAELKPALESQHPINRSRQTLFGHSLGGWFVLYTFFTQPQAFSVYAAGSPSIWWKKSCILPYAERLVQAVTEAEAATFSHGVTQTRLYIGVGSLEKPHMVADAAHLYGLLSSTDIPGLRLKYRCLEEEDHLSVIHPLLGRVLRFALTE